MTEAIDLCIDLCVDLCVDVVSGACAAKPPFSTRTDKSLLREITLSGLFSAVGFVGAEEQPAIISVAIAVRVMRIGDSKPISAPYSRYVLLDLE